MLKRNPDRASARWLHTKQRDKKFEIETAQSAGENLWRRRLIRRPLLELWLPAETGAVADARHKASEVCRKSGISAADYGMLDLAVGEALANAVVHGIARTTADNKPKICLSIWRYKNRLMIEVHDRGPGFDPPPPPYAMPSPEANDPHGRGLPLIENITDAMLVSRGDADEGGASVYMVKEIPA